MNNVSLVGRLTADPEIRHTTGENAMSTLRFNVAVNRPFKNKDGEYEADFISCQAFRQTADFIAKYFKKGQMIGITGSIRTGRYTNKEGVIVYTTDVAVSNVEFIGSKSDGGSGNADNGFMNIPDDSDDEGLPFN